MSRCRDEVSSVLGLKAEDIELSMGMSGDYEQAVTPMHASHKMCWALAEAACPSRSCSLLLLSSCMRISFKLLRCGSVRSNMQTESASP